MIYTKTCPVCGKAFEAESVRRMYCSEDCAEEANRAMTRERERQKNKGKKPPWKVPKKCRVCGVEYMPKMAAQIIYGRKSCRDEMQRRRTRGYDELPESMAARTCPICGTVFQPIMPNQITCADEDCRRTWRLRRQTAYNRAHKDERNRRERERQAANRAAKKPKPESLRDAVRMPDQAKPGRGRRKGPRPGSLEWCVREADKRGMSYGQFVAAMESGVLET